MSQKLTVERAHGAKADLRDAIERAICCFVAETGLAVSDILLTRHVAYGSTREVLDREYEVTVKVEL